MDGLELAAYLKTKGYTTREASKTKIVVVVNGDRIKKMLELATILESFGAVVDRTLKASSIGGIVVGKVKIYIKSEGRTGGLDVEAAAIALLQEVITNAVMQNGGPISIKLKNRIAKDIVGVRKTAGTPKSDFHLIDSKENPVVHISHKKGSTPRDFQQWGGITESEIARHPELKYFEKEVNKLYPGGVMPNQQSAFMKIKDNDLKMMSVYGVNYAKSGIDVNKVDVLIQGDPGLKLLASGEYELTGTGHVHYLPEKLTGGFEPILAIIYKGDRTQLGLRGGRASIYPIGGRTFKTEIKNNS